MKNNRLSHFLHSVTLSPLSVCPSLPTNSLPFIFWLNSLVIALACYFICMPAYAQDNEHHGEPNSQASTTVVAPHNQTTQMGSQATVTADISTANNDGDYSEQDKQNAIIMCMTVEYVKFHQYDPAEQDVMSLCLKRFKNLRSELPYTLYKKGFSDTVYNPKPDPEVAKIRNLYNSIMLGEFQ